MITSTSNQKVKRIVQLQKKARQREKEGVFIVEGIRMCKETPPEELVEVYISESCWNKQKSELEAWAPKEKSELVSDEVLAHMSDTQTPQGVLCVVRQRVYRLEQMMQKTDGREPLFVVLDNLQDPGNLGTILRTAEGAGVTGIVLSKSSVSIYNPKVIRSTMGSIYRMPFVYVEDLPSAIDKMQQAGIVTYAAHLEGRQDYDEEDYNGGIAFLIGNEGNGLSDAVSQKADIRIKIPMEGKVESLNAAVAASLLMYEAARQRRKQR